MKIKAININKSYVKQRHELNIIRDFSCEFNEGGLYLFKGASGSGKTTLLSIFGLIDKPTSGELIFDGNSVLVLKRKALEELRRANVGFVFQEANLLERLTIKENLILSLTACGYETSDEAARADALLERVGLSNRAEHYPFELSGGEKQRVSFARAISRDPKLLICDEPTASLDSDNAGIIRSMVSDMKKRGCIVLLSSHSSDFDGIADTVINVERGMAGI